MGEPMTSTAGALSSALGAGLGAMVLTTLGVHPQPLFWALVGATLGMSLAPQAGRLRALAVFAAVVLASALLGTWAARTYVDGSLLAADGVSCLLAVAFHPLLLAFVNGVPAVLGGWLKRLTPGGGGSSSGTSSGDKP